MAGSVDDVMARNAREIAALDARLGIPGVGEDDVGAARYLSMKEADYRALTPEELMPAAATLASFAFGVQNEQSLQAAKAARLNRAIRKEASKTIDQYVGYGDERLFKAIQGSEILSAMESQYVDAQQKADRLAWLAKSAERLGAIFESMSRQRSRRFGYSD